MNLSDDQYIKPVMTTKFLSENTKKVYLKKLNTICQEITGGWSIDNVLKHPEEFHKLLEIYGNKTKGHVYPKLGTHAKEAYVSAIISLFIYNQKLKESRDDLFNQWKECHAKLKDPISKKYQSNEPSTRQAKGYISFIELITKKESLKAGSLERLLLTMYTEIPPVRSDYASTRIYHTKDVVPSDYDGNYVVLDDMPRVMLQKYKTKKTYKVINITLPPKAVTEIYQSLILQPRGFLFVSTRSGKPYENEKTFNTWANRTLKDIFANKHINLTMLRHIYISRRDLELETKSGLEQKKIADIMGHSIDQQRKYMWHSWLKK